MSDFLNAFRDWSIFVVAAAYVWYAIWRANVQTQRRLKNVKICRVTCGHMRKCIQTADTICDHNNRVCFYPREHRKPEAWGKQYHVNGWSKRIAPEKENAA